MDNPSTTGDMVEGPAQSTKTAHRSSGRRTHRACDRCRVKKSKCNGQQPCNTCKANERTCVFSALRRRDIRKWHCHMQDTVDEAIQRLYRACKAGACFPGVLPDEKDGYVTTESILQGMGFTNLDIGPQSAGIPIGASLQHLPLRQRYIGGPVDDSTTRSFSTHHVNRGPRNSHSDTASVDSPTSTGSPHLPPGFHASPMLHGLHNQHPSGMPLLMHEQFGEALKGDTPHGYLPQHHHHHHHFRPTPPDHHHQPQQPQHHGHQSHSQQGHLPQPQPHAQSYKMEPTDHTPPFSPVSIPFPSTDVYMQPPVPLELKGHYGAPPYYVFDGGPYVNPEQVWSRHYGMATVSQ